MKRNNILLIFGALILLTISSCSKTEEFQHNTDSALQIESVSGISPFSLMQEPTTKAVITGDSLPGDEAAKGIGLFVTATGGGAYDGHDKGYTNVKYTFDGSKWSAQSPIYLSDNDGKLYGYFPYNADATDLHAIPVESSLNDTDYLFAKSQTVNHSNKSVSLTMKHALSCLHLTIKKGANFTAEAPLSKITLTSTAIDATGTMDLVTGAITASKKSGETGTVELATDGTITAEGIEKDILLVPADNSEGKKDIAIILTIGGKLASISLSGESGLDIRSGILNNVTLTIEDTGIKITGVGVGTWGDGCSQSVEVGGHKVTVMRSDEDGIANDVFLDIASDGSTVTIKTLSATGRFTQCTCTPAGKATLTPSKDETTGIYTFTLSNIETDITATIGYVKSVNVSVSSNDPSLGTAQFVGDCYVGGQVTFTAKRNGLMFSFVEWQDADGKTLSTDNPYIVTLTSDLTVIAIFKVISDD